MQNLRIRYDAVQEALFAHYEQGSKSLNDQVSYWELRRRESAILYWARKNGISTLGFQPVPSLQSSEANAKSAIGMSLTLQSLLASPFGQEPWTLPETSLEMWNTPPKNCMKKHGFTVEVHFDNDPENAFPYTCWQSIYYQDAETNEWVKTSGKVAHDGMYYEDKDGEQVYFCHFETDASRFSTRGIWRVLYKNVCLSASVSSSGSGAPAAGGSNTGPWWGQDWPEAPQPAGPQPSAASSTRRLALRLCSGLLPRGRGTA